jgi:hypothetical protein
MREGRRSAPTLARTGLVSSQRSLAKCGNRGLIGQWFRVGGSHRTNNDRLAKIKMLRVQISRSIKLSYALVSLQRRSRDSEWMPMFDAARAVFSREPDGPTVLSDPAVPDWTFLATSRSAGTLIVIGVAVTLDATLADPTANLTIHAEELTINGTVVLPGKNVEIHARRIVVAGGSTLDVSGLMGQGWPAGFRVDGGSPGANGQAGDSGQPGGSAGSIAIYAESMSGKLVAVANGGAGGRGRDGGNGAEGALGQSGTSHLCSNDDIGGGGLGKIGGTGGDAGIGGAGGIGGDGGSCAVRFLDETSLNTITCTALGGLPGAGGTSGRPGIGGQGGSGGMGSEWDSSKLGQTCVQIPIQPGAQGPPGVAGSTVGTVAPSVSGNVGTTLIQKALASDIAASSDISHLQMLSHRADILYLSGQYASAADSLTWIEKLTREQAPSTAVADEWNSLNQLSRGKLSQLGAGLDFYGLPKNNVPLVNFQTLDAPIAAMIATGEQIEQQYAAFRKVDSDEKTRLDAIQALLSASQDSLNAIDDDLTVLGQSINEVEDTLAKLADALQSEQLALQADSSAFQQAVVRQLGSGKCTFLEAISFAATMVSLATSWESDLEAIVSAAMTVPPADPQANLVTNIQTATNDINDLRVKFSNIKDSVANFSNSAKIAMAQADVDALLGSYSNLPEALAYKAELDAFFSTCLTRSQKAIEFTGLTLRLKILMAQRSAKAQEAIRLQALLHENPDPALPAYVSFLAKLVSESKRRIVLGLYEEHRAYQYWSLTDTPFSLQSYDSIVLKALHDKMQADAMTAQIERNRAPESFGDKEPIVIVLSAQRYPSAFAQFLKTNTLNFSIPFDEPEFRRGVFGISLSQVAISVVGLVTDDSKASVRLEHHGRARFLNQALAQIVFSHAPRRTQFIYDLKTGDPISDLANNLGQDHTYAGLSPFASWTLSVDPSSNANPILNGVSAIELRFGGFFSV